MYNMDEKGCMLGILARSKRVFSRRLYEEGKMGVQRTIISFVVVERGASACVGRHGHHKA
jgi:hypothetical protein